MNVQPLTVDPEAALAALREYKSHRDKYDARDWEIERIYRQIAKGKTVISVADAIRRAGVDSLQRPVLAIARADLTEIQLSRRSGFTPAGTTYVFMAPYPLRVAGVEVSFPDVQPVVRWYSQRAIVPRIPPQHRPAARSLRSYHILWEADWHEIPRDPYLLRRIGKDAWVVLAAWELTDVELSVLRAHQ